MSARCCHVVGDGLGPVGCGVGVLCQLACPSRRPSSFPRSRWVVVGRSRTARRSQLLMCEGCLMARCGGGTDAVRETPRCPAVSDECVETARPLRPTSMSLCPLLVPSFAVSNPVARTPSFPCVDDDSMGRSRCEEAVPYRVAGSAASGGSLRRLGVGARRVSLRYGHIHVRSRSLPMLARMDVSLGPLASVGWIPARSPTLGSPRPLFFAALRSLHA